MPQSCVCVFCSVSSARVSDAQSRSRSRPPGAGLWVCGRSHESCSRPEKWHRPSKYGTCTNKVQEYGGGWAVCRGQRHKKLKVSQQYLCWFQTRTELRRTSRSSVSKTNSEESLDLILWTSARENGCAVYMLCWRWILTEIQFGWDLTDVFTSVMILNLNCMNCFLIARMG